MTQVASFHDWDFDPHIEAEHPHRRALSMKQEYNSLIIRNHSRYDLAA
jgi:hypothetical protein